jgi:hypothetical protein
MDIAGYQAALLEIDGNLAKIDAKKGKVNELKGSPDSVGCGPLQMELQAPPANKSLQ